jgi:hypothetical protein
VKLRSLAVVATAATALALLPLVQAAPALAAGTPPWEPDPNSVGTLTLYDASGNVITGGNVVDLPFVHFALGSADIRAGDTKATLFAFTPNHTKIPSLWSGEQISVSSAYPNLGAPAPLNAATKPLVSLSPTDGDLQSYIAAFPNTDATPGYVNTYQLRVRTSAPGKALTTTYLDADIVVSGGTWTQVYPPVATGTPTTTALSVTPASPQPFGATVTLKATMTPVGAVGSVQFFDGASTIGAPVPVAGGVAQTSTTTLAVGAHSLKAKFTPTDPTAFGASTSTVVPYAITPPPAQFTAVGPCRIFDTRSGPGSCSSAPAVPVAPIGAGKTLSVKVTGVETVPVDATAVVLNLTAVGATTTTFVTAWPTGSARPTTSNLNVNSSKAVPNMAVVPVGTGGKISFFNSAGSVNLIADISGYFSPSGGATFTATGPCRMFDTRTGTGTCSSTPGVPVGPIAGGHMLTFKVTGAGGVPATATAVVLNLTAVGATTTTFLTAWPDGAARPTTSNLNVNDNKAIPNMAVVPVGAGGMIDFFNANGNVNLITDISGYFAPGAGSSFTPTGPCRVFDTRVGTGTCTSAPHVTVAPIGQAKMLSVKVTGVNGVPATATAVVLNLTAVGATGTTFITAWPDGSSRPLTSNLNVNSNKAIPNMAVVPVGTGGKIDFFNALGSVNLIVDISGYLAP